MDTPSTPKKPRTRGLNHINLLVADVARSRAFYERALGFEYVRTDSGITFLTTPGTGDSLALQPAGGELDRLSGKQRSAGEMGGVDHIGLAVDPEAVDEFVSAVNEAGGALLMQIGTGTERTAFVTDPDGYVLQLG